MPVDYKLNAEARVVHSRAWGHLVESEMWNHIRSIQALFDDGTLDASWAHIADFSAVETLGEAQSEEIRRMAKANPWPAECLRALITPTDLLFGLARMYQLMGGEKGENIRVVRSEPEALQWIHQARTVS